MTQCVHCNGDIEIRNPTGYCDHLKYPEYCETCAQRRIQEATPVDFSIDVLRGLLHLGSSNDNYRLIKKTVIQDTIARMEEQKHYLAKAHKALAFARSMILSGEKMSDTAANIFNDVLHD